MGTEIVAHATTGTLASCENCWSEPQLDAALDAIRTMSQLQLALSVS